MNKVFVLYPKEFKCKSKFARKIKKIVSRLDQYSFICPHDSNKLLSKVAEDDVKCSGIVIERDLDLKEITHGILFCDEFCFRDEKARCKQAEIPLRIINTPITRVINIKTDPLYAELKGTELYEYIGRGSYWGNPYSMYEKGEDRDSVIQKYRYDFENNKFLNKSRSEVYKLRGKWLGCYCKPYACHGDILADYLNSWDDNQ